eukprot:g6065.t1
MTVLRPRREAAPSGARDRAGRAHGQYPQRRSPMRVCVLLAASAAFMLGSPALAAGNEPVSEARASELSSPIVYQGRLSYLDIPVTTSADLRFRLYDAMRGGERIGREIGLEGVLLEGGAFEAVLDFGSAPGGGWIEVDVRSPSGAGEFTTLSPRQRVQTHAGINAVGARGGATDSSGSDGEGVSTGATLRDARGEAPMSEGAASAGVGGGASGHGVRGSAEVGAGEDGSRGAGWLLSGTSVYYTVGNVGIGTVTPSSKLHVRSTAPRTVLIENPSTGGGNYGLQVDAGGQTSRAVVARATRTVGQNYAVFGQSLSSRGTGVFGQAASTFGITYGVTGVARAASGTGVRGLATNPTGSPVGVYGETNSPTGHAGLFRGVVNGGGNPQALDVLIHNGIHFSSATFADGWIRSDWDLEFTTDLLPTNSNAWYRFWTNGNPGAGTEQLRIAHGNEADVLADGSFVTNGIDYAEAFSVSDQNIEAGDVVSMVRGDWDNIRVSTGAYDGLLLGVVSTRPGFVAGLSFDQEEGADAQLTAERDAARASGDSARARELTVQMRALAERQRRPIALAGRVPVKVDAGYGAIRAGDRLTSSATPGHAMVQTRPGPSLGIALEDFESGRGMITLLVQPGWTGLSDRQYDELEARNEELEGRLMLLEKLILGDAP